MEPGNLIRNEKLKINQMGEKYIFNNFKSDYFLEKLFDNLNKKRALDIIKYNKNIKNRINININDYKEYSGKYSSIEIEIKPAKNKNGRFINIKKEDTIYVHIYFNNNKEEEIKRSFIDNDEKIEIINIIINYQFESFEYLFKYCDCIESINFKKFCRNNISKMCGMFCGCSSLKELNFISFNTNNVVDMSCMFYGCCSLKELNINNFNFHKVSNISKMFFYCSSLKELNLNLNNFNTHYLTDMNGMFVGCSKEFITKIKTKYKNIEKEAFIDFFGI